MKLLFLFFLCIGTTWAEINLKNPMEKSFFSASRSDFLLAKNSSAFDPFIDYGEFQDEVTEEESINFFHYGRSLSLAFMGGYEAITCSICQIYGDSGFIGVNATFFLDLRFAIQLSGVFPTGHYNSLYNTAFPFAHYGLDLKYYWNRQYLSKDKDFFSPYVIFGPFQINIKSSLPAPPSVTTPTPQNSQTTPRNNLSRLETQAIASYNAAGIKAGFGFELALIQQSFIGFEITYLYTVLQHENEDLSHLKLPPLTQNSNNQNLFQRLQFPNRPETRGYRFDGDLVNMGFLFGVNF